MLLLVIWKNKKISLVRKEMTFRCFSLDTLAVAATSPHFDRFETSRIPNENLFQKYNQIIFK